MQTSGNWHAVCLHLSYICVVIDAHGQLNYLSDTIVIV